MIKKDNETIVCIGSGNMGRALMKGVARAAGGVNLLFTDHTRAKAEAAAQEVGGSAVASNEEAVRAADVVFLAVKPAGIAAVVRETVAAFTQDKVVVSMAGRVSLEQLAAAFAVCGDNAPQVIRIMPNTPTLVGKGLIALTAPPSAAPETVERVRALLAGAGVVDVVDEKLMDAIGALSGSGPAFVCLFMEALADSGVFAGLPRDKALRYAALTVEGAAALALQSGKHPGVLKDEVTSPGGTTIRGIAALEDRGFRGAVMSAVLAAYGK
ncbi:MAG: pyrroline-5-carboxylate reductase [Spirochaetaceae bacterium]|jgi:pyrroline-5-carboxylate reductase|nr:pyrroline-5-carboxylate reductase [Spirochaetaceae bacterium]